MGFELKPTTEAGEQFVRAAEGLQDDFVARADENDRTAAFPAQNFRAMQAAGVLSPFVPEELGGLGLNSVHDWIVGIARLARGDGSTAIAANMHIAVGRGVSLAYGDAKNAGDKNITAQMGALLKGIADGDVLFCATATEPGTDYLHALTEATKSDDGWRINGTKIFVTLSPIATHVAMNLRIRDDGQDLMGSVMLPIQTEGIEPQDDWDALGMRASGSQTIKFDNVKAPEGAVRVMGKWGQWSAALLMNRNLANMPLLGASIGIAEAAYDHAITASSNAKHGKPRQADRPEIQNAVAEMEIKLATARALLSTAGAELDGLLTESKGAPSFEEAHQSMRDFQSAKWIVNKNANEIVNQAMDVVGGSAFMSKHPLSRLYRDVRAAPFMQPYSPTEARSYVGKVSLGIYPKD
jgi:alkylation response protein AidB-like acyl-CoA dehydrogenase